MESNIFFDDLDKNKYFQETKENPMIFIRYDKLTNSWIVEHFNGSAISFNLWDAIKININNILRKIGKTIHYIIPSAKHSMKINGIDVSYYIIDNNVYFDIEHISKLFFNQCYFTKINEMAQSKVSPGNVRINKELRTVILNILTHSEYPVFGFTLNFYGGLTIRNLISYEECYKLLKHKNIKMYKIKFNKILRCDNNYMTQIYNIPALSGDLKYNGEVVYIRLVLKHNDNMPYVKIIWTNNWLLYQNDTSDEDVFSGKIRTLSKNICIKSQSILFYNKICELADNITPSIKYQHIDNTFSLIENKFVDNYVSKIYYYHPQILNYFNNIEV